MELPMTSPSVDRRFGLNSGTAIKAPCRVAATTNLTLSGLQTVNGVSLAAGDRVLVTGQTNSVQNGIYVADTGAWQRATDFDDSRDVSKGTIGVIMEGTYQNQFWMVTTSGTIRPGSTSISFAVGIPPLSILALASGSSLVGFLQSGAGAVAMTMQDAMRERVSVKQFGATGDGVTIDTTAIQAAITRAGTTAQLRWPAGTYLCNQPLTVTSNWIAEGEVTIKFSGISSTSDCISITGGATYQKTTLEGFTVNCQATGRDGVVLLNGDHPRVRVRVINAQRDGFAVFCGGFDWVENAELDIYTEANGRHGMRIETWGSNGAFFNESSLRLEVRGVSLRYNSGYGLAALCPGTAGGSKIASLHITQINLDAQRAAAVAAGFDIGQNPIRLVYSAGGTNKFEAWKIDGGGFETTTGSDDFRSPYLILADSGVSAPYWDIRGIVPANWSTGAGVSGLTDYFFHSCKDSGGVSTSRVISGSNLFNTYGASSTFNIDIPIPELPDNGNYGTTVASILYDLTLSYQQFSGSGQELYCRRIEIGFNKTGGGAYWLSGVVVASSIGTMIATVNSVAISGTNLRVNVTTGAGFAGGGGDNHIHAALTRLSVARS
jgi:hypothetical protein